MKIADTVLESDRVASSAPALDSQYLRAELARIDVRIRREVRRWQRAGQDAHDDYRGLYVSDTEATALMSRPLAVSWGQTVTMPPDEVEVFADAEAQATAAAEEIVDAARRRGVALRLRQCADVFGLDQFERDTLLICLAPALDLRYEKLYGYLQDNVTRTQPSVNLVLDLLCKPGVERFEALLYFDDDSRLFRPHLLEWASDAGPLLRRTLRVDDAMVAWLLGRYSPHADLRGHAHLQKVHPTETDRVLAGEIRELFIPLLSTTPVIGLYGPDQVKQNAAARLLAFEHDRPLLTVDVASVVDEGVAPTRAVRLALRDARLTGALPYLTGWDACLNENVPPAGVLVEVCAHPDIVILSGRAGWQPAGVARERRFVLQQFAVPLYAERCRLWRHFLGDHAVAEQDIASLAGQFALTAGTIRDAVATALDRAAQRDDTLCGEDLFAAARDHSSLRLGSLARKIDPRFDWDNIILPGDQHQILRELVATVRSRPQVLEVWGVGQKLASSSGVTALFAGPPGTGKTMAAEVIAGELELDLYKIDLSSVVSKYIGETEKNLERIFDEAETSNAILFFDEADALFGKRSEVRDSHDRYANIEISYLLQRMEAYDGVTILATNLRANLDEAFTRRLQFVVDFPFPQEADRLRIWQTLFPPGVPRADDLDLGLLARRYKLAGGNIRNVIVNATYLAAADGGVVTMDHLLHGTLRELQKMGKWIGEDDFDID